MVSPSAFILIVIFNSIIIITTKLINFDSSDLIELNKNLRKHFHHNRRQKLANIKRVQLLDHYLSNSTIFVDGIPHRIIDKQKDVYEIENEYKSLIQMKGLTYNYNRDMNWRTWRKVTYPDGRDVIVCYRCTNSINSTNCQDGGYWVIEDQPPLCTFEILSIINDNELCAYNLINNTNIKEKCPYIAQLNNILSMCDNPIQTRFQIMKEYGQVSERNPFAVVICNGRDFCEISTVYMINKDSITFKIINSTNHIIYSRIMKNGGKNYACVNCGKIDPTTNTVQISENPVIMDLLNKNKRENSQEFNDYQDIWSDISEKTLPVLKNPEKPLSVPMNTEKPLPVPKSPEKALSVTDFTLENVKLENISDELRFYLEPHNNGHKSNRATCQSLKHFENDDDDETTDD